MKPARPTLALTLALGLVTAALLVFGWRSPQEADMPRLRPDDSRLVQQGAQIYGAQCASCHGDRLQGQPRWREPGPDGLLPAPPHDASGHTWHHPDELLFRITKYGMARAANIAGYKSSMPVYEGQLSDEQIIAVLSWIKTQWPPDVRRRHDEINAEYLKSRRG